MADTPEAAGGPGILYYDPNPTTAKLATATLRIAGYVVFNAHDKDTAVALCEAHGPAGDRAVKLLLLDASADPKVSANVLASLAKLPGAAELPGILMVSRRNTDPIPGTGGLPKIKRPFSSPALLKVVERTLAEHRIARQSEAPAAPKERETQLKHLLSKHGDLELDDAAVAKLLADLEAAELPTPAGTEDLKASLGSTRLEAVLEMLATTGASGVLTVEADERVGKLHLFEGKIRLAEYRGKDEDLKFGRFVIEAGFMRDEELEAYIVGRDPEGRPLGKRLVDGGFLTREDLAQVLVTQAREVTCHLLLWSEGQASFRATSEAHPLAAAAAEHGGATELSIAEVLLDGLRRLDERAVMGAHMPDVDDVYIRLDDKVAALGRERLERDELEVLELINGRLSVKDIARKTRSGTFNVAQVLYRLSKSSVVRRRVMPVTV